MLWKIAKNAFGKCMSFLAVCFSTLFITLFNKVFNSTLYIIEFWEGDCKLLIWKVVEGSRRGLFQNLSGGSEESHKKYQPAWGPRSKDISCWILCRIMSHTTVVFCGADIDLNDWLIDWKLGCRYILYYYIYYYIIFSPKYCLSTLQRCFKI